MPDTLHDLVAMHDRNPRETLNRGIYGNGISNYSLALCDPKSFSLALCDPRARVFK
jgi:hypothetical protein